MYLYPVYNPLTEAWSGKKPIYAKEKYTSLCYEGEKHTVVPRLFERSAKRRVLAFLADLQSYALPRIIVAMKSTTLNIHGLVPKLMEELNSKQTGITLSFNIPVHSNPYFGRTYARKKESQHNNLGCYGRKEGSTGNEKGVEKRG